MIIVGNDGLDSGVLGYDTVKLFLPLSVRGVRVIRSRFENTKGQVVVKNFQVSCSQYGINLTGSLSRCLFDQNVSLVTCNNVCEPIEYLSDQLGQNIGEAVVTRLDIASSIPVTLTPTDYFRCFEETGLRKVNNSWGTTVYLNSTRSPDYRRQQKCLVAYDKAKESEIEGNLLRLELRLQHRVKKQLRLTHRNFQLKNLTEPIVYRSGADHWRKNFLGILRNAVLTTPKEPVEGVKWTGKDVEQYYFEIGVNQNRKQAEDFLKELSKRNCLPERTYYRLFKRIRSIPEPELDRRREELKDLIETTYQNALRVCNEGHD